MWWTNWTFGLFASRPGHQPTTVSSVPEIDASTGLLAVAAIAAVLALAWERRKRQA